MLPDESSTPIPMIDTESALDTFHVSVTVDPISISAWFAVKVFMMGEFTAELPSTTIATVAVTEPELFVAVRV